MDVEVFIYGTPIGNSFYGKKEEKNYFDTLYNSRENQNFLLVNIRKAEDNNIYCYYNYLIYQKVIGKEGRSGSFFGITLRLDAYCMDIKNIYGILNTTYNTYIKGELFESIGESLKYIVNDFSDTSKMEIIKKTVEDLFSKTFKGKVNTCFTNIDNTFALRGDNTYKINLYDFPDDSILQFIKETGKYYISPYYPTQEISKVKQQYDKQLKVIQQQHESEKKVVLEKNIKLQSSLTESRDKEKSLQFKIDQKNKEIQQLENKLNNFGQIKEIDSLIEQIKNPIEKLSNYIGHITPVVADKISQTGRKWYSNLFEIIRKSIPFVNMFLLIFLLFHSINIISFPFSENTDESKKTIASLEDRIRELEKENHELNETQKTSFPNSGIKIDIKGESEPLKKDQRYTIRAIMKEPAFRWVVEGAKSTTKDGEVLITPNAGTETVCIRYLVNETPVIERKISVIQ